MIKEKFFGGYFGLESQLHRPPLALPFGLRLHSGRACLQLLIRRFRPESVFLPFYCCDALAQPFREHGIEINWYSIDQRFEPTVDWERITPQRPLVYINYFGLKNRYARQLAGHSVWLDNTNAFFANWSSSTTIAFNSARKFFGVPDGAFLTGIPIDCDDEFIGDAHTEYLTDHLVFRHVGLPASGLDAFRRNDSICGTGCNRMSSLTEHILERVPFELVKKRRQDNFFFLHRMLQHLNSLDHELFDELDDGTPYFYPWLPPKPIQRSLLWDRYIFVPEFWKGCHERGIDGFTWEKKLTSELIPIPIDHRYDLADMTHIANVMVEFCG